MIRVAYFVPAYRQSLHPMVWRQGVFEGRAALMLGYELVPMWEDCNGIDMVRNRALAEAMAQGADYLMFQDADVWADSTVIPPLMSLCRERGAAAAVCGVPLRRQTATLNLHPLREGHIYEVELAGTGLMLLDLAKLRALGDPDLGVPWFRRSYTTPAEEDLHVGGDVHFVDLLRKHGLSVWADTTIRTCHATQGVMTYFPSPGGKSGDDGTPPAETVG